MMGSQARSLRYRTVQSGVLLVALVLAVRLVEIQIHRHAHYYDQAQKQWKHSLRLAPKRGNLYDRDGRPLALSVETWRVGVATSCVGVTDSLAARLSAILGQPATSLATRIRRGKGRQHVVLMREAILAPSHLAELRKLEAVTLESIASRVYPLGGVGASLIGFHRTDGQNGDIATGLEQSLNSHLAGTPGEAWCLDTALPGRSLGQIVRREPQHGRSIVLTLDADLQRLCEDRLARSIATCGAKGGAVLIADPLTGDILAAASWPLMTDRDRPGRDAAAWNNFNFTGLFEPGSVFKIFSAAALLHHAAIDTATVFDCSEPGPYRIRNCEADMTGPFSFMPAFFHSNNIYFARASDNLGQQEFYRYLKQFGFGQPTRFPYGAQPSGILRPPDDWSGRSKATIAIGQEVAVTPLQLLMGACAIANGGYLYAPRIVQEIRDIENRQVESQPPIALRRVVSEPLTELLRQAMRRVVREGTGRAAEMPWIKLGGKTGTAQKCVDGRGYAPGLYVASFVGCVPYDRPRLVILTLLDEPDYAHHYAAQSAVPLFADIVGDIRRATDWLTDLTDHTVARRCDRRRDRASAVPDLLYLSVPAAAQELGRVGLVMKGGEKEGTVIEQIPSPGSICCVGDTVQVTMASRRDATSGAGSLCPDLRGLSNRAVRRLAARLGVRVDVAGFGYVRDQQPRPGTPIGAKGITVRMVSP